MAEPIEVELKTGTLAWCTCAQSENQPYCDGSHKGTGKSPMLVQVDEPKKAYLCVCKETKTPPYCDGSHASA